MSSWAPQHFPERGSRIRLALPRGPLQTELWHFVLLEKDAAGTIKARDPDRHKANNGAAGMFEQDDVTTGAGDGRQYSRLAVATPGSVDGAWSRRCAPGYPGLVSER